MLLALAEILAVALLLLGIQILCDRLPTKADTHSRTYNKWWEKE